MSSRQLKNQMRDVANNLFQDDDTDDFNNVCKLMEKKANTDQGDRRNEIEKIDNDFNSPMQHCENNTTNETMIKCDAIKDGCCDGEIKRYGNRHFNCLSSGEYHSFCKYHYDNAVWCPAHPCFNKIT